MATRNRYSQQFKERAARKALIRGNRTIAAIAAELGVSHHNLKNWLAHPQFTHLCGDSGTAERGPSQPVSSVPVPAMADTSLRRLPAASAHRAAQEG
ncbi:transposase, partial [Pusillimonas sp.]|uniref:transposase n=1 Tax=Pusillimonas sp. TaxID=3040095 RepID=UPI0029B31ED9